MESVPSFVVGDARSVKNGWSLEHELHNCFLDIDEARQRCEMSSGELLNMVIYMRAALLQLYNIFSMRYRFLSEKYANPTLSANLHYALLASDDSEIVYSAKTTLFESSRLAPRMHSISREQAQLVTSDALPPETGLPIDTLLGSRGDPCQRPPPSRQPPPPIESGCCRCLRCHATHGSSSNGSGGGW